MLTSGWVVGSKAQLTWGSRGSRLPAAWPDLRTLVRWKVQGVYCGYCLGSAAAKQAGPPTPEMPSPPSALPSAHPEQQG